MSSRSIVCGLASENPVDEAPVDEYRHGELAVEFAVDASAEDLLEDVENDVVEEVVPREVEKQVLR